MKEYSGGGHRHLRRVYWGCSLARQATADSSSVVEIIVSGLSVIVIYKVINLDDSATTTEKCSNAHSFKSLVLLQKQKPTLHAQLLRYVP